MPEEAVVRAEKDISHYAAALEGWLASVRPDLAGAKVHDLSIPKGIGHSNETVFFSVTATHDGAETTHRYVARIEPADGGVFPEQSPACGVSVALQHRMMDAVSKASDVPMAGLLPYESDPGILGNPFFVMEHIPGVIPLDLPRYSQQGFLADEATPAQREKLVRSGLQAMAKLHAIDWKQAGLDWLHDPTDGEPGIARQIALYRRYAERQLDGREHPKLTAGLDWLESNPPDVSVGMSWGDARIGNMIFDAYECAAVLDWEAACVGPTELDLGWWVMFDRMSFERMDVPRPDGMPSIEQQMAWYEEYSGRSAPDIHYWEAFAVMRFGVVMIRLGDRTVQAGLVPPENNMATNNFVTDLLADLVGEA